jgi:hypothetical protein
MNPTAWKIGAVGDCDRTVPSGSVIFMRRAVMIPKWGFRIIAMPHRTVAANASVSTPE